MTMQSILQALESWAPPAWQESYDNAGLLTGDPQAECTGILCCLDVTEAVIEEAVSRSCNLIVAHHPLIFGGLKRLTGQHYVERTVIRAIRANLAIYAIHTNLDNVLHGVNGRIADQLGLQNRCILQPKTDTIKKLITFVPHAQAEQVRQALFAAGAGVISAYDACSFNAEGIGTFRAGPGSNPFTGRIGEVHREPETRIETVFPAPLQAAVMKALRASHPYEEIAFDILSLDNPHPGVGGGLVGEFPEPLSEADFLSRLRELFHASGIRHTALRAKPVRRVALCGGAGSFLTRKAISAGADAYVTADVKYHEFFEADGRLLLADIGHYESEQFTVDLLARFLQEKFPTFAVFKTGVNTNPVHYYH